MAAYRRIAKRTEAMTDSGLYVLWIYLPAERRIRVGALGEFTFQPGMYAYVGSAQRSRTARVRRHLRREKAMRWHIDYFRPCGEVISISYVDGGREAECRLVEALLNGAKGRRAVPRFGDGDCGCGGHLLHFPDVLADGVNGGRLGHSGRVEAHPRLDDRLDPRDGEHRDQRFRRCGKEPKAYVEQGARPDSRTPVARDPFSDRSAQPGADRPLFLVGEGAADDPAEPVEDDEVRQPVAGQCQ